MSGSIVVDLKQGLKTALTTAYAALADFNGTTAPERLVEVSYGYDANSQATERVFFGRARSEHDPAALATGRSARNENGVLVVIVLVEYVGGSAEDAEDRALAVATVLEEVVADRKSNELGLPGLNWLTCGGYDLVSMFNDRGHLAELTYRLRWNARLT